MSPIRPEQDYFSYLAHGRFMLLRSRSNGRHFFYPRIAEPSTGARDLEWVPASGYGTVYATTVVRVKAPQTSYNVTLIDLDEGPRILSRVEGIAPESVFIGMRVQVRIGMQDEHPIVLFDPIPNRKCE